MRQIGKIFVYELAILLEHSPFILAVRGKKWVKAEA
jgi:hypothetical protein